MLESIIGDLVIRNNALLPTAPAFLALGSIDGTILVRDNAQLSTCCGLFPIAAGTIILGGATPTLSGNATGCNALTEIATACVQQGDLSINVDGDVPALASSFRRIKGNLTIGGTITAFPDFSSLGVVEGNITINAITTATLTDLDNLFPALDSVYETLQIQNQTVVATIRGFVALESIGGNLSINDNTSLTTLPDFGVLNDVGDDFLITGNAALPTLPSFSALTRVGNDFLITGNTVLTPLSGFGGLMRIDNRLSIANNAALSILSGFTGLTRVGSDFDVQNNTLLTSISGFSALTSIGGSFTAEGNTVLSLCCGLLRIVGDDVTSGSAPTISGNAAGCNAALDIENSCAAGFSIAADDDVPSNLATLVQINGNLTIGGTITSFPDFAALRVVEGDLLIDDITTTGLTGLSDIFPVLDSVRGSIQIQNNEFVETITGFVELDSIGNGLILAGNEALTALPPFSALKAIGNDLIIQTNPVLGTISGFSSLRRIGDVFLIFDNIALTTISGFDVLSDAVTLEIGNIRPVVEPTVSGNPVLTSIPSFSALTNVHSIFIVDNNVLTTIPSFSSLRNIEVSLFIDDNLVLEAISGFDALETVGDDLVISDNAKLVTISGFGALREVGDNLSFANNIANQSITGFGALESIDGDLAIGILRPRQVGNTVLSTLPDFAALKSIRGTLRFVLNPSLTSLPPFAALTNIGGTFLLASNHGLTSVSGFGSLTTVGGIDIQKNQGLRSFSGFSNSLVSMEMGFDLWDNDALKTVSGFDVLERMGRRGLPARGMLITSNAVLESFPEFPLLEFITGSLFFVTNDKLTTLPTFASLETIGHDLWISRIPLIQTISGFQVLKSVGRNFQINRNSLLRSITGFGSVTTIPGRAQVRGNSLLSDCCGLSYIAHCSIVPTGDTDIQDNARGCESVSAIQRACPSSRMLSVSENSFPVTAAAGNVIVNVTANVPWEITKNDADVWITSIAPDSGTDGQPITIRYAENAVITNREAVLTLSSTDGCDTREITLTQEAAARQLSADKTSITVTRCCRQGYRLQCHGECALGNYPSVPQQLD